MDSHPAFLQTHGRKPSDIVARGRGDRHRDRGRNRSSSLRRVRHIGPHDHRFLIDLSISRCINAS
jgi:hypothetical protein